jgi:hypothetical protein
MLPEAEPCMGTIFPDPDHSKERLQEAYAGETRVTFGLSAEEACALRMCYSLSVRYDENTPLPKNQLP